MIKLISPFLMWIYTQFIPHDKTLYILYYAQSMNLNPYGDPFTNMD